jgi:hypothetical protein
MRWFLVIVTAWLSGNIPLHAQTDDIVVPTQMCRGFFFVPITLHSSSGGPDSEPLWFIYDTGAARTIVDPDSVERVSGRRLEAGRGVRITNATAGPVTYNTLPARLRELDHLSYGLGRQIDGILGYEAFGRRLVTLDYVTGQIRLSEGTLPRPDGETIFDADGPDRRPWLRLDFPDRSRRMLIDSGAGLLVLAVNDLHRYPTQLPPTPVGASLRLNRVEARDGARLDGVAAFGPNRLEAPTLQSTPGTELIGGEVMRHFTWTFDPVTDRVRIVRNEAGEPIRFGPTYGHGMVLEPHARGLQVGAVLSDSPAERGGVQRGDVVTHFNGQPLIDRDCNTSPMGQLIVTVERDGVMLDLDLDVIPLVE